jgi:hypothetical protein
VNGSPEKIDEGVEAYKSRVVPALRERDGYSGARLIVDRIAPERTQGGPESGASLCGLLSGWCVTYALTVNPRLGCRLLGFGRLGAKTTPRLYA